MPKAKRMKKNQITTKAIIRIIFIIILLVSIGRIAIWYYKTNKDNKTYINLKQEILLPKIENNVEIGESRINFEKLKQINNNIVGWIKIDETNIDYPIVQATDNNYYLKKNIYKQTSTSGSIYLDYRNNNFNDTNTIIYGHNMKNGTMFAELKKIYEGKIQNNIIKIQTETEEKTYKIISTYIVDANYNMEINIQDYNKYISSIIQKSKIKFTTEEQQETSQILTLITCSYNNEERIVVQAIEVNI